MAQWKGESVSEEEYNFNTFDKNKGQSGGALSNLSMEEPKTTGGMVTQTTEPKKEPSQAEQLVNFLRSPDTQSAGIAAAVGVGTALAGKSLLGRGKNATQETPRVEPTFTEPTPFAPQKNAQPDVTDVASRPVGQSRPQLGGPTTAPAPVTPSVTPAPPAPSAPIPSAPAGGAPAPVNVAPAPVAPVAPPAPVDPIMQAKLDAIADKQRRENEAHTAQQRRLDEIHQTKLANEAKRAELGLQKNQGKTASTTSVDAQATQLLVKSEENKLSKAVASASAPKPVTNAVPPPVATVPTATSPITAATPATTPVTLEPTPKIAPTQVAPTVAQASNIKEISLPKEWPSKGMNWITAQYGIEGAQQFIDKYNEGKPFKTHAEMDAVYQKVMTKPSFSTMPKELRKERGIKASERELLKIIPRSVPPPSVGGSAGPVQGGGSLGGNRPGEDFMHNLNPLKL